MCHVEGLLGRERKGGNHGLTFPNSSMIRPRRMLSGESVADRRVDNAEELQHERDSNPRPQQLKGS